MSTVSEQDCDVQLQTEIEVLKSALADKHSQLVAMENACLQESDRQVELEDSIIAWQDKYERLYESHKRVQKINQSLEDKLLKLVDRNSGERAQLTSDVATLSVRLAQANYNIQSLKREIERYKTDMSVAIQLLQCKPDSFVSPKLSSLPIEIQSKVATYMRLDTTSHSDSEGSTSGVGVATASSYHVLPASDSPPPMCPFPPTAMVYSMRGLDANQPSSQDIGGGGGGGGGGGLVVAGAPGAGLAGKRHSQQDSLSLGGLMGGVSDSLQGVVSPSVMAKFLEDELKSSEALLNSPVKHCETCICTRNSTLTSTGSLLLADLLGDGQKYYSVGTQTVVKGAETNNSLCLRCNNNLNSPSHHNSPYIMKLIKSSDSVISETKSSVSDYLTTTPDKNSPNGTSSGQIPLIPATTTTKKDDLMVNPILGHHRLSDRTSNLASTSPNSDPLAPPSTGLGPTLSTKSNNTLGVNGGPNKLPLKKPLDTIKSKVTTTSSGITIGGKYTSESPSYIIKDTDQMSAGGSHALQTPKSGVGGTGEGGGDSVGQLGKVAGGSVGSGLYHAVGSTNSLWSRTSSRERDGAKIFENFNRNLIKTIKAENPKMSGPRICALRIQNGSSNILLDSLHDDVMDDPLDIKPPVPVAPVIYTRRAKFLDEELLLDDDPSIGLNGAIKTTSLPTAGASLNNNSVSTGKQQPVAIGGIGFGVVNRGSEGAQHGPEGANKDVCNMSTTTSPHSSDRLCTIGEEVNNLLLNTKVSSNVNNASKPRPDISVNKLEGIDLNSKKSCTQSSSISSEIDIQESALLRRQQLSRVAEWVQNNSKLGHPENLSNTESDSENLALATVASLTLVDSINNNNALSSGCVAVDPKIDPKPVASDMKISHSINSSNSAVQQPTPHSGTVLSNSNSYNNNHIISGNNNHTFAQANCNINGSTSVTSRGHSHTSLKAVIASNAAQLDYNSNSHSACHVNASSNRAIFGDCPRQRSEEPQLIPEHLYPLHNVHHQSQQQRDLGDHDDSNSVDLAQMEYNVKQFLLKQNEWSSISRRLSSSTTSGTIDPQQHLILDIVESSSVKKVATGNGSRTGGNFPGMAVAQMTAAPQFSHATKYTINPHRTETNL